MLIIEYVDSLTKMPFYKVKDAETGALLGWYERESAAEDFDFLPASIKVLSFSSVVLRDIADNLDKVNGN